jgi:hypothetical protein
MTSLPSGHFITEGGPSRKHTTRIGVFEKALSLQPVVFPKYLSRSYLTFLSVTEYVIPAGF